MVQDIVATEKKSAAGANALAHHTDVRICELAKDCPVTDIWCAANAWVRPTLAVMQCA